MRLAARARVQWPWPWYGLLNMHAIVLGINCTMRVSWIPNSCSGIRGGWTRPLSFARLLGVTRVGNVTVTSWQRKTSSSSYPIQTQAWFCLFSGLKTRIWPRQLSSCRTATYEMWIGTCTWHLACIIHVTMLPVYEWHRQKPREPTM